MLTPPSSIPGSKPTVLASADAAWRDALVAYMAEQARPVEKFGHQPRLYALTRQIAADSQPPLSFDDDIVFAAAWLHDLGVFTGHRPEDPEQLARWDNTAYAVEQAPAVLLRLGFPPGKITAVQDCIRTHQPAHDPQTLEATLLRDADILEQLGAIAVLRTVCKVGRDTRFQTFTHAVASLQQALDQLPDQLRLPASRTLAEEKIRVLRFFLAAAQGEAGDHLD